MTDRGQLGSASDEAITAAAHAIVDTEQRMMPGPNRRKEASAALDAAYPIFVAEVVAKVRADYDGYGSESAADFIERVFGSQAPS